MEQNNGNSSVSPDMTGTGYLVVQVTTARGAIPLEGASVNIRSYLPEEESDPSVRGDYVATLTSGRDGNTARIPLSAPPRSASAQPGGAKPYALYSADVSLEGYFDQSYAAIPIFDGITAVQPAVMIPLPENGTYGVPRPGTIRHFEGSSSDL